MAGDQVVLERLQLGPLARADFGRVGTAPVEGAAGRRIERRGQLALERDARPAPRRIHHRRAGQKRLGVGMARPGEDRLDRPLLHRPAQVHDHDLVGDVAHHAQVVGDEEIGEVELLLQVHEQVEHLGLDRDVERRDRLVGDQDARAQHERAGDGDALALAAGEHVRVAGVVLGPQAHLGHHLLGTFAALGGRQARVDDQGLLQDRAHFLARIERAVGVLEHDLDRLAEFSQGLALGPGHVGPIETEPARGRRLDQRHQARQGRLAAARLADHRQRPAARQGEAGAGQRLDRGVAGEHAAPDLVVARQIDRLQHRCARERIARLKARGHAASPAPPAASRGAPPSSGW